MRSKHCNVTEDCRFGRASGGTLLNSLHKPKAFRRQVASANLLFQSLLCNFAETVAES